MPALCLSLDGVTAIKQADQGLPRKMEPYVLCSCEIDREHVVEFVDEAGLRVADVGVPCSGGGADTAADRNLVLWRWGPDLPHRISVDDPSGRLPRNQLSWD